MPSEDLDIGVEEREDDVLVTLAGEVDFGNVARLRAVMVEQVGRTGSKVTLDLAGVSFLDSMGLSVLIQAKRNIEGGGGRMTIVDPAPRVRHVLEVAGVADYLLA